MSDAQGEVRYSFILEDNVTPATQRMEQAQDRLAATIDQTSQSLEEEQRKGVNATVTLTSYREAIASAAGEMGAMTEQANTAAAAMSNADARTQGVTATAQGATAAQVQLAGQSDQTTAATDRASQAQERLAAKARKTNEELDRQRIKNIETLASLNAFRGGIGAMTGAMNTLGLVDQETYKSLQKVVAGMTLVSGAAEALKGGIGIMRALQAATKSYAVASVFASIAANPLLGLAAVAGAAGAGYGFMQMIDSADKSSTQNTVQQTTNINFASYPGPEERVTGAAFEVGSYYS